MPLNYDLEPCSVFRAPAPYDDIIVKFFGEDMEGYKYDEGAFSYSIVEDGRTNIGGAGGYESDSVPDAVAAVITGGIIEAADAYDAMAEYDVCLIQRCVREFLENGHEEVDEEEQRLVLDGWSDWDIHETAQYIVSQFVL